MAAVTAWAKPGAWALDAEEHEVVEKNQYDAGAGDESSDFPSLAAAAASKIPKKKAQTLSLAEFNTGSHGSGRLPPPSYSSKVGLTPDELLVLPTGPRERSAEELERASYRGFGSSYGGGSRGGRPEDSVPRWGLTRGSDEPRRSSFGGESGRDQGPSRADEVDDWGAVKKTVLSESRERRAGGFFDSQSRADESDSWISNKGTILPPTVDGRRMNGSFDGYRERRIGFDKDGSTGPRADSETWGKKKVEEPNSGGRRRLVLQPRSLPLDNTNIGQQNQVEQAMLEKKIKGSNPFGDARPREDVLAEKGQDWKKIDEKLDAVEIKEVTTPEKSLLGKKVFGTGSSPEDRTEKAWRNPVTAEASPPRAENVEEKIAE